MAFTVEDGRGLEDANSYVSVSAFTDYCALRKVDISGKAQDDIEAALVAATDWIDSNYANEMAGWQQFTVQALQYPRQGLTDPATGNQRPLGYMPPALIKATCIVAIGALSGALWVNVSGAGPRLTEKTIGPITYKYAATDPSVMREQLNFDEARAAMAPLLRKWASFEVCR